MKSMKKIQSEMLAKAVWDGAYPKAIHMGLGIIALADNAEEEYKLKKDCQSSFIYAGLIVFVVGLLFIIILLW